MNLVIIWVSFIYLMTFSKELDESHYLLFNASMFYITYLCNQIYYYQITFKTLLLLFTIPSFIFWYIILVSNSFFCLNLINYKLLALVLFSYACALIIFYKSSQSLTLYDYKRDL